MENDLLIFNGIDAASGSYLLPPLSAGQMAAILQGGAGREADKNYLTQLKNWYEHITAAHFGLKEGSDPKKLEQAGWGVIFPANAPPALREALSELLDWRKEQASRVDERYYREFSGADGYLPGDTKLGFLERHGAGPGAADPDKVPYYLLIAGDPEQIPYRFQYQLDVQYGVGRIHFDSLEDYARYAHNVVEAEKGGLALAPSAAFFGTRNPDDVATNLSAEHLIAPLAESFAADQANWRVQTVLGEGATKARLGQLLGGDETPALLFTASHGMSFPNGDPRQLARQGALLCQDWPGPRTWRTAVPEEFYFSGEDLAEDARLECLIAFHFACYGAGTPRMDDFARQAFKAPAEIAPRAFLAGLPKRMLAHPRGGALAVVGHVERAWGYSFLWGNAGRQLGTFNDALKRLAEGHPIGSAVEVFNTRYAELASDLDSLLEEAEFGKTPDPLELAGLWTANNDARNYMVIGDPAVRMMV